MRALIGLLLALWVLSGCSSLKRAVTLDALRGQEPVKLFRLDGRLSVKTETQRISANLIWNRAPAEERLLFAGPLGQGAMEILRQEGRVMLKSADGTLTSAESDELLLERVLGVRLPLDGLVWWLSALPRPDSEFVAVAGEDGRLSSLDQDGWHIEYSRYQARGTRWLPGRIFVSRGELELRLVVDHWDAL